MMILFLIQDEDFVVLNDEERVLFFHKGSNQICFSDPQPPCPSVVSTGNTDSMSNHGAMAQYISLLISASLCSGVLMGTLEGS